MRQGVFQSQASTHLDVRRQHRENLASEPHTAPLFLQHIHLVFGLSTRQMLFLRSPLAPLRRLCIIPTQRAFSATLSLSKKHMDPAREQKAKSQRGGKGQKGGQRSSAKLRGLPSDNPDVRLSKSVSWILRHGAEQERLELRPDGYARVQDLVSDHPNLGDDV